MTRDSGISNRLTPEDESRDREAHPPKDAPPDTALDGGRPNEHDRDSSIPDERRPAPEPAGDAQPPVVTGAADDDDEPDGAR